MARDPLKPRGRRWRRWFVRALAATALLLIVLWFGRGVLAEAILERVIASNLNAKAEIGDVSISAGGTVVVNRFSLQARGIDGVGAEVFSVERLTVKVSPGSMFRGLAMIREIALFKPVLRISQSVDDASVNVGGLIVGRERSGGKALPETLPRIVVENGLIELGEHSKGTYAALKRVQVEGLVEQSESESGESVIRFGQVDPSVVGVGTTGLLDISGRYSRDGLSLQMADLSLADLGSESLPTPIRDAVGRLGMEGRIENTVFRYGFKGEFDAAFELAGVSLSLPLKPHAMESTDGTLVPMSAEEAGRSLRMSGVSGKVVFTQRGWTGTLRGFAEELPYEVTVDWRGGSLESPFDITLITKGFDLKEVPRVLKYAPGVAQLRFQQFGNPTATMDADVRISRGEPINGAVAEVTSSGRILLTNASAAFHKFPYRFYNMKGEITFDSAGLRIVHVEGDTPSGATVVATGTLMPLKNPTVVVDVVVQKMNLSPELRTAMRRRGKILEEMFSERQYERLLGLGLVRRPGSPGTAPEFEPGAVAEVTVKVIRNPMADGNGDWHDHVTVAFERASILPDAFPFPLLGEGFVMQKDDHLAVVTGGTFRGLTGGTAQIAARVDLERLELPGAEFVPDLEVSAKDVPVSPLLLAALPESKGATGDERTLGMMLGELNVSGVADAEVRLSMPENGEPVYDIDVALAGLTANPAKRGPEPERLRISDIRGKVNVTRNAVSVALTADAQVVGDPSVPGGVAPAGTLAMKLTTPIRGEVREPLVLHVDADNLLLQAPVEDVVAVFAPSSASVLDGLRSEHRPRALVDGGFDLVLPAEGAGELVVVARPQGLGTLTVAGQASDFTNAAGAIAARFDARTGADGNGSWVDFESFKVDIGGPQGGAVGSVVADGRWWLEGPADPMLAHGAGRPLSAVITNGRFEHPLVRAIAGAAAGSGSFGKTLSEYDPAGTFSAEIRSDDRPAANAGTDVAVAGVAGGGGVVGPPVVTVSPTTLALTSNGVRVNFSNVSGSFVVERGGGRLRAISAIADGWSGFLDGGWRSQPDGSIALSTRASLASTGLPAGLRALLPPALTGVLASLSIDVTGPLAIENSQIGWTFDGAGTTRGVSFEGPVVFDGLSADIGAEVTQAMGRADVLYNAAAEQPPTFDVRIGGDSARVAGIAATDYKARITSGATGDILVPVLTAAVHGGKVSADALVRAATTGPLGVVGPRGFEATVTASGIRFASLLTDLSASGPADTGAGAEAEVDEGRGHLDANFTLKGRIEDPESRRGRGTITIGGGKVLSIPLVVPLVRVANFQFPSSEGLNFAMVEFFIEGGVISVEQVAIESESVGLYGYGTALWPSQELDLRFRSRSRSRIPVVSDVLEKLRGEIVTAVVRGTLKAPSVSVSTFAGTSRFLGRVLGQDPSEQQQRLEQIERQHGGDEVAPVRDKAEDVVDATPPEDP